VPSVKILVKTFSQMATTIATEEQIADAIEQIAEKLKPVVAGKTTAFIGLKSIGDIVAERLVTLLAEDDSATLLLGALDASLYRDDFSRFTTSPKLQGTEIDFALDDAHVILVDDVLFTGRTVRSALDAITDYGRPQKIELAVLIDRGHRELPIEPNYVGISLETAREDNIKVTLGHDEDLVESIELNAK